MKRSQGSASAPERVDSPKGAKLIGHVVALVSSLLSLITAGWGAYIWHQSEELSAAGRMNEGDREGCIVGLLYAASFITMPVSVGAAFVLAVAAIALKARLSGSFALFLSLVAAGVYIGMFHLLS